MTPNILKLLTSLKGVVSQENKSLKQGDLAVLNKTLALKQALLVDLDAELFAIPRHERDGRVSREMQKVGYMLKDNERLMRSAINSVRFACKQIAALKTKQSKVGTYDRYGKTVHISDTPSVNYKLV